jgi:hypothetical protein
MPACFFDMFKKTDKDLENSGMFTAASLATAIYLTANLALSGRKDGLKWGLMDSIFNGSL